MYDEKKGFFGDFGGQYVPDELTPILNELAAAFEECKSDPDFQNELEHYLKTYVGRPSLLYHAERFSEKLGGAKIYLKREDLNHTGSHKINNAIGQALLAKKMGKKRVIAETGAGQHGVATATVAALFGMECKIFMGAEDVERQALNVFRMQMLGAEVIAVTSGTQTLKEAVDEAINYWVENCHDTFYVLGSAVGPHPYPSIVRYLQRYIGLEARQQILELERRLPDSVIACVGGGSNAIGLFQGFLDDASVNIYGVEAAGKGVDTDQHAATMTLGKVGVLHGFKSYVLQDDNNEVSPVYSISAGLDYPGVGPEHAYLRDKGRVNYVAVTDKQAVDAFYLLSQTEGIIPALESSHALAYAVELAPKLPKDHIMIVNLSGRGDKDVQQIAALKKFD
ncbi:tryptophan synthase subunit beta [Anaerosporomusa subterranea]|uniref:Tryptophan synthase beta chain n=1 Tax=Anaerosporomusa subterranea TaxID=1794912 RepID=A0A154BQ32_ANASB|nr:tryptophan synthase subunit beta [Anaerosporomusa subterranea]KYZ76052.1 tryptophan synthase subunit beta [Anaerosporomusa subterranea]